MSQDDLFSRLPQGSFDGITIPVVNVKLRTGSSAAFHRYPFRAGVDIEYTGREPVSGTITAAYFTGLFNQPLTTDDLWPGAVTKLRERAQRQLSGALVIPPLGTLPKAKIDIEEDYDPMRREGCMVTINFVEDSKELFTNASVPTPSSRAQTAAKLVDNRLALLKLRADLEDPTTGNRVDFATFLSGLLFRLEQFDTKVANLVSQVDLVVDRADTLLKSTVLRSPSNWETATALRLLADSLIAVKDNLGSDDAIKLYEVGTLMPVAAVAVATRNSVTELLKLNPFENALQIEPGTQLLVYARAA